MWSNNKFRISIFISFFVWWKILQHILLLQATSKINLQGPIILPVIIFCYICFIAYCIIIIIYFFSYIIIICVLYIIEPLNFKVAVSIIFVWEIVDFPTLFDLKFMENVQVRGLQVKILLFGRQAEAHSRFFCFKRKAFRPLEEKKPQ